MLYIGRIAQAVERRTENPCVGGSTPSPATFCRSKISLFSLYGLYIIDGRDHKGDAEMKLRTILLILFFVVTLTVATSRVHAQEEKMDDVVVQDDGGDEVSEDVFEEAPFEIEDFVAGTVTSIDPAASKLIVKSEEGSDVSVMTNDTTEIYLWDERVKLDGLNIGDEIEVGYIVDEAGVNVATWIDIYRNEADEKTSEGA